MVTAELAIAILAIMPLVMSILAVAGVASAHVRCSETARTAARQIARGDSREMVREQVAEQLPGSTLDISTAEVARVEVTKPVAPLGLLPALTVRATATTPLEGLNAP